MPDFTVILRPLDGTRHDQPLVEVGFQGFQAGAPIDVSFWSIHDRTKDQPEGTKRQMGVVSGTLKRHGGTRHSPLFGLEPEHGPQKPDFKGRPWVGFVLRPGGDAGDAFCFALPHDVEKRPEGEIWEVMVQVTAPKVKSAPFAIAWPRYAVPWRGPERLATYEWLAGNTIKLYNDASEDSEGTAGAFHDITEAIQAAKHFIFIVDWSFHPLLVPTRVGSGADGYAPKLKDTIGAMLVEQARKGVVVAIHTWNHASLAADDQNNRTHEILRWIAAQTGGWPDTLFWRGGFRGITVTHHQKFVALDCDGGGGRRQVGVFWGGLDLTKGRFDWPEHPILAFDPAKANDKSPPVNPRAKPFLGVADFGGTAYHTRDEAKHQPVPLGDDWYNAELAKLHEVQVKDAKDFDYRKVPPRQPWHDIHGHLVGPTGWDFVREFIGRWSLHTSVGAAVPWGRDIGDKSDHDHDAVQKVLTETLADRKKFVQQWEPSSGPFAAQMLRSMVPDHWGQPTKNPAWNPDRVEFKYSLDDFEHSIQDSYVRALSRAERFVYIETQYLIGSGRLWDRPNQTGVANRIPETIVARILERAKERRPFHVYMLIPMYPEGDATSAGLVAVRRFEWRTMWYMIRAVDRGVKELNSKDSWKNYMSFHFLAQWHRDDGTIVRANKLPAEAQHTGSPRADLMNTNLRHMIYIHSKLMIVDDRYLILGSANLNERSLAGNRDSEDCVAMWPAGPKFEEDCVKEIQRLRGRLWDEHLGGDKPGNWDKPWEKSCADAVQKAGLKNWKEFRTGKRSGDGHLVSLPFELGEEGMFTKATVSFAPIAGVTVADGFDSLPDALDPDAKAWKWESPGLHVLTVLDLSE